jgi:hypothetical protein
MIRHSHGRHAEVLYPLHQLVDAHGTVEQRVFGVKMKMDEGVGHGAWWRGYEG